MAELNSTNTGTVNPSDENFPLLTEHLLDNVVFNSPLSSPLPCMEDQLWMDSDGSGLNKETEKPLASSIKASDSPAVREAESLFGPELIPTEVMWRARAPECECLECGKVFRTTDALDRHILTHQSDLIGHVLTQRKAYCCQVSLKHHCVSQPRASQPSPPNPLEPSLTPWETPPVTEGHSPFPSPPRPASVSQLEQHVYCGESYSSCTEFDSVIGNLGLNHSPEEASLSDVKLTVMPDTWNLTAVDLPASHDALASNQWALSLHSWYPMAPKSPEERFSALQDDEDNLDFPVTKGLLSEQSYKEELSLTTPKRNQPILLKHSLQQLKENKLEPEQVPFIRMQPCSKPHSEFASVASPPSHQREPGFPDPPLSKRRKRRVKKNKKTADTPAPPLPGPRTSTQRRARPPADIISPSQVAMASFSTESTPSRMIKGRSAAAMAQDGRESGVRTYLNSSPSHSVQSWSSVPQGPATSSVKIDHQEEDKQDKAAGPTQVSPLVIPVSVPVLGKEATLNKTSTEKRQNIKGLSKKSRHTDLPSTLIIPRPAESCGQACRAAPGYPSQLRSPTFVADHMLKSGFQPPPYTPPPMLSPLRPGTGLYFCTLNQYQACPPPPCSCTTFMDEKDTVSLMKDNTVVSIEPKINIGSCYQAKIPPLRKRLLSLYDEHPAQLVWAPWGDLLSNPETQQRVTAFLDMCCSSVLPGGGTNTELALHCLHEVQGDILAALDLLLLRGDYRTTSHTLSDYHYAGSDQWSAQERRLFQKALLNHNKDFQQLHNMLQTKSVAQCVEYYYAMNKLKRMKQ